MSRYGSLTSDCALMNFYASRLESSFKYAKSEIARLTNFFKHEYEQIPLRSNDDHVILCRHCDNPNIIRDPVKVKTKGLRHIGLSADGVHRARSSGTVKKTRLCRICYGVSHDARNCQSRPMHISNERPSTSNNASGIATGTSHKFMMNEST
ncbi:hypothetical protein TorRG33x02_296110 [Trema orientale]|uniref:Uncharacterized protein n=1 Tax=Trema orientale TaxID=63057 RepID=A0A2P5C6C7_TREOI|nr:hypothetical protein TorRG33x02_296110 [Trema orientale]